MQVSQFEENIASITRTSEEDLARKIAEKLSLHYLYLDGYPFSLDVLSMIPLEDCKRLRIGSILRAGSTIQVALVHPEDTELLSTLEDYQKEWQRTVEPVVVSNTSMAILLSEYERLVEENVRHAEELKAVHDHTLRTYSTLTDPQAIAAATSHVSTSKLVDILMAGALNLEASDVHIEPAKDHTLVRYRIDGVLEPIVQLAPELHKGLVSRIKVLSSLSVSENGESQDGRFSLQQSEIPADVRVSSVPTQYGEALVLRLLRQNASVRTLDQLGFSEEKEQVIRKTLMQPYGLILVTGPTGSGKSTTLYALLQILNTPDRKIISLEDPIEYRITGVQQSEIDPEKGFTFSQGLRGAMRQDPDVIFIGEIRDAETAALALQASQTGHLVLATLHTNTAVGAMARLREMGVADHLLVGSIRLIIGQRLIRVKVGGTAENPVFKGRTTISELLIPSAKFEQAVLRHSAPMTLQHIAEEDGLVPLVEDGLEKIAAGTTTKPELQRVALVEE